MKTLRIGDKVSFTGGLRRKDKNKVTTGIILEIESCKHGNGPYDPPGKSGQTFHILTLKLKNGRTTRISDEVKMTKMLTA